MSKMNERGRAKAQAKQVQREQAEQGKREPKDPPSVIQLPGGVVVKGFAFRITKVDDQGRPEAFEIARGNEDSDCVLWATPSFINDHLPDKLLHRVRRRIEESIEGPGSYDTQERTYTKERAHGISVVQVDPSTSDALKRRLAVGERNGALTVRGLTSTGQVEVEVNDPAIIDELKKGTAPVSIGAAVVRDVEEPPCEACRGFPRVHTCDAKRGNDDIEETARLLNDALKEPS